MNEPDKQVGDIGWVDLTIPNAEPLRRFYKKVVGWKSSSFSMGDYDDYCMQRPDDGATVSGICHARGCQPSSLLADLHQRRQC
jgi:hypothetical protein